MLRVWLNAIWMRIKMLLKRRQLDRDLEDELSFHLAKREEKYRAEGIDPEEARYAARRQFGNAMLARERSRELWTFATLETIWQDVRFGTRTLRKNPGFTAVAVLSLALGIGANTAIFQLIDAVRLRTLPAADPQQLAVVRIADLTHRSGHIEGRYVELTNAMWEQIRDHQKAFSSIFAWGGQQFNLATGGEVRYAQGIWVSGDFFKTLKVSALVGRTITSEDDHRGCGSPPAARRAQLFLLAEGIRRQAGRSRPQNHA